MMRWGSRYISRYRASKNFAIRLTNRAPRFLLIKRRDLMTQKHASYVHYTYYKLAIIVDFFFFMENSCAGKAKAWFYAGQFNGCGKFCQVTKTCKNVNHITRNKTNKKDTTNWKVGLFRFGVCVIFTFFCIDYCCTQC